MPTIEVKIWDLERIARTRIAYEELEPLLVKLKCEVEELERDTLVYEASHDRPDLFSAEGLGRALRSLKGIEVGFKEVRLVDSGIELITDSPPAYRPYVLGAVVDGLRLDDEAISQLFQLQEKLHLSYCGDRSLAAIGLHDLDQVSPPIYYKTVNEHPFKPLGCERVMSIKEILSVVDKGIRYRHLVSEGTYPLLVDSRGTVLSMPPIINSEYTRITPRTKNVFIDVTGTEPELMNRVLNVMVGALVERSENPVVHMVRVVGEGLVLSPRYRPRELKLTLGNLRSLTGIELRIDEVVRYLGMMGLNSEVLDSDTVLVRVPPYRIDVMHEVDLVEDVLIAYGYDRVDAELLPATHPGGQHPVEKLVRAVRDLLIGLGVSEVVNFMLTDPQLMSDLGFRDFVSLKNPKMKSYSALRSSLIPSILQTLVLNARFSRELRVFEVGDVVVVDRDLIKSTRRLCVAVSTPKTTLTDVLVILKSVMSLLGARYTLERCEHVMAIPGRCGRVLVNGLNVGMAFEVHPRVLSYLSYTQPIAIFELDLSLMLETLR